jgi:hypothetical protein
MSLIEALIVRRLQSITAHFDENAGCVYTESDIGPNQ